MILNDSVDNLTLEDIHDLIDHEEAEGKEIEYKRELDFDQYAAKHKQLLVGEIVSFANDGGGYVIVGVDEDGGVPTQADGFEIKNPDAVKERWASIIRSNTDPELPPGVLNIGSIHVAGDNYILVIQVDESWRSPHRETVNNAFYARSPSGKVELNVEEVRHRILGTDRPDELEKLKQIRDDRIELIREREGIAAQLEPGAMTVVHALPAVAATDLSTHIPASDLPQPRPLGDKINRDDMTAEMRYAWTRGDDNWYAYGLIDTNGLYEFVGNMMFSMWDDETMIQSKVTSTAMGLDASIIVAVKRALTAFNELDFAGPVYIFVSLLDAADYKIDDSHGLPAKYLSGNRSISTDVFTTPPVELTTDTDDVAGALEAPIDTIYHQMSWEDGSPNYSDGEWSGGSVKISGQKLL